MRFHFPRIRRQAFTSRLWLGTASERFRRPLARLRVEGLESRCLLSVAINEFPVPTQPSVNVDIVSGPDGNLWFTENLGNKIGQINPSTHAVSEFPIPGFDSGAEGIVSGPDGNLWFTEELADKIGQINPTTHAITEFPIPTSSNSAPHGITAGPDGNLWFTENDGNKIGQINPSTHVVTEYPIPTARSNPSRIAAGPDGNLWFTEGGASQIGEINPTTHAITEFPIPTALSGPFGITAGPDGNLWFTEQGSSAQIGEINPTTHAVSEFPVLSPGSSPSGITAGPDGNLWFTEQSANQIGEINPTTHAIAEFSIPTAGSFPSGITAGPDGNLWFTEMSEFGNLGQVVPNATAPDLRLSGTAPGSVTVGDNVTYTLVVTNFGSGGATGVKLTDTLPSGVTFVSATGGVTSVRGVLTFSIGDLVAGASASFTIVVTPTAAGALTDSAAASMVQADPTPADNSLTLSTAVTIAADTPDLALLGSAPNIVALGTDVNYTLKVTNGGPASATGVKLIDTLPMDVTFRSATGEVTPVKGDLTFTIGNLAVGASVSFTIMVTPTAVGTLSNRATVSQNQVDPTPADNSVTQNTGVYMPVQRTGIHNQSTTLVLRFDEPLDPGWAQNLHNYHLVVLGGSRRTIRIKSAAYDSATRTVTLRPVHQLNLHNLFRLTVGGAGSTAMADPSGHLTDAQKTTGDPGRSFVTLISAADLVLTTTNPSILRKYNKILFNQSSELKRLKGEATAS